MLLKQGETMLHMLQHRRWEISDLIAAPTIHASSTPGLGPNDVCQGIQVYNLIG
jgi:hypothetical protein